MVCAQTYAFDTQDLEISGFSTAHVYKYKTKGKTGRWEEAYSKETIKRFEEWETKWLDGTGLSFTYKL